MDFAHEIGMRQLRILAGSITSLIAWKDLFLNYQVHCSLVSNTTNMYQYQYQVQRDWGTSTKYNRTGVPVPSTKYIKTGVPVQSTRLVYQYQVQPDWGTSTKYIKTGVPVPSTTRLGYQYKVQQDWCTSTKYIKTGSLEWKTNSLTQHSEHLLSLQVLFFTYLFYLCLTVSRISSQWITKTRLILPAKARKYVFTGVGLCVCLSVCLSVTTITKKICGRTCTKFYGKVPRGKWKTKFVFCYDS